jgi:anti-sigma factor RsiW
MTAGPAIGPNIGEDELLAYVDGRLDEARTRQIDAMLEVNPVLGDQVRRDRDIADALRAALAVKAEEGVPPHLRLAVLDRRRRQRRLAMLSRAAAAVLIFAAGAGGGWLWRGDGPATVAAANAGLVADATLAHRTYTAERRHAVEVAATEQEHLVAWLGNRLHHKLIVPDLTGEGFRLMGGRLLPSPAGPAGQLMYENAEEVRLTIYVRPETGQAVSFRLAEAGGTSAFFWVESGLAYSLTADLPRERLMHLARLAHQALDGN